MKLENDISLVAFRDEMQHRVVKYGDRSRQVREAVRFSRTQKDKPEYYRVAMEKIHAQRQFRREAFGPTKWEAGVEFFTLGSLREVVVTLLLVVVGVGALEMTQGLFGSAEHDPYDTMDVDELANRLGLVLENSREANHASSSDFTTKDVDEGQDSLGPISKSGDKIGNSLNPASDEHVDHVAQAIVQKLLKSEEFKELIRQVGGAARVPQDSAQRSPRSGGGELVARSQQE